MSISPMSGVTPPRVLAATTLALTFVLYLTVGAVVSLIHLPYGLFFTQVFLFLGSAWSLTTLSGRSPWHYVRAHVFRFRAVALGALLGVLNFFAIVAPLQFASRTWLAPWVPTWLKPDSTRLFENALPQELAWILFVVVLLAPVSEEFLFRGVVQNSLLNNTSARRWRVVAAVALIFSAFHLDAVGLVARFELGLLFGALFILSRSLWPGVAAHLANNAVAAALYFASKASGIKPDADVPVVPMLILCSVALALMALAWRLAQKHLSPETKSVEPVVVAGPRHDSLWHAGRYWMLGAVASLALLVTLDPNGVRLGWIDLRNPVRTPSAELQALRKRTRQGQVPLADYVEQRKAASHGERQKGQR
ncbi:MAG: lysostaphin resistance A-like protein [Myxococcaceae bacterium]